MELSRFTELFLSESREHISTINRLLLTLEQAEDVGVVEEIFRAAHTLKGMSAAMGCTGAAEIAHALEHVLDQLRQQRCAVDPALTDALFAATDALEHAIEVEASAGAEGVEVEPVVNRLQSLAAPDGAPEPEPEPVAGGREVRVTVMIQASSPLPAVRAMLVLKRAREIGGVAAVEPDEERLNAGDFSGSLAFRLTTAAEEDEIRAALSSAGEVAHVMLEEAAPEAGPAGGEGERRGGDVFVRVSQERLDVLVNQVGEMVIARDRLRRISARLADPELEEVAAQLSGLIGTVRDEVMGMRMTPVGEAFDRFPRLVRDTARALDKRVAFEVTGRDIALDRSLHNELADLLLHLLRNALDHGIELPDERRAAGKPETGQLQLSAARERDQVVVRVRDDGRGIRRDRVLQAAVARGLVDETAAADLPDEEVYQLITRSGFSTAERVTDVSGRGVGLDVVASRIRAFGGSLEIESEPGKGTTFVLRLPLSLAIVRALQVRVGDDSYVIPISSVGEVVELDPATARGSTLTLREESIPLLDLRGVLTPDAGPQPRSVVPGVVVETGEGRLGLLVDQLIGHHEAVLKPFDAAAEMTHVFAGATLLADGRPALILDVERLAGWWLRTAESGAA